jgi:hypothetical protein
MLFPPYPKTVASPALLPAKHNSPMDHSMAAKQDSPLVSRLVIETAKHPPRSSACVGMSFRVVARISSRRAMLEHYAMARNVSKIPPNGGYEFKV